MHELLLKTELCLSFLLGLRFCLNLPNRNILDLYLCWSQILVLNFWIVRLLRIPYLLDLRGRLRFLSGFLFKGGFLEQVDSRHHD